MTRGTEVSFFGFRRVGPFRALLAAWGDLRRQTPTGLLNGRQGCLGLGEWAGTQIHARRLRCDFDFLSSGRVSTLALLLGRFDAHGELNEAADAALLGVPELFEHDLVECRKRPPSLGRSEVGTIGDGGHELRLC